MVARLYLALRQRRSSRICARSGRGAQPDGGPAGCDRVFLRQPACEPREPDHSLRVAAIRRGPAADSSAGTADDDHNPPRVAPRHLFDLGIGTDNLLRSDGPRRITAQLMIVNLTNKVALYNFLSTFSGTHFVSPRTYNAEIGFVF